MVDKELRVSPTQLAVIQAQVAFVASEEALAVIEEASVVVGEALVVIAEAMVVAEEASVVAEEALVIVEGVLAEVGTGTSELMASNKDRTCMILHHTYHTLGMVRITMCMDHESTNRVLLKRDHLHRVDFKCVAARIAVVVAQDSRLGNHTMDIIFATADHVSRIVATIVAQDSHLSGHTRDTATVVAGRVSHTMVIMAFQLVGHIAVDTLVAFVGHVVHIVVSIVIGHVEATHLVYHSEHRTSIVAFAYPEDKRLLHLVVAFAPTLWKAPQSCIS